MKNIYIAGPMTGIEDFNYPKFNDLAAILREKGFAVENPAENPESECKSWEAYMRMSIVQISKCDTMVMLPDWRISKGARIEHKLAEDLGMTILDETNFIAACNTCGSELEG